jgi:hypothetical protein
MIEASGEEIILTTASLRTVSKRETVAFYIKRSLAHSIAAVQRGWHFRHPFSESVLTSGWFILILGDFWMTWRDASGSSESLPRAASESIADWQNETAP